MTAFIYIRNIPHASQPLITHSYERSPSTSSSTPPFVSSLLFSHILFTFSTTSAYSIPSFFSPFILFFFYSSTIFVSLFSLFMFFFHSSDIFLCRFLSNISLLFPLPSLSFNNSSCPVLCNPSSQFFCRFSLNYSSAFLPFFSVIPPSPSTSYSNWLFLQSSTTTTKTIIILSSFNNYLAHSYTILPPNSSVAANSIIHLPSFPCSQVTFFFYHFLSSSSIT